MSNARTNRKKNLSVYRSLESLEDRRLMTITSWDLVSTSDSAYNEIPAADRQQPAIFKRFQRTDDIEVFFAVRASIGHGKFPYHLVRIRMRWGRVGRLLLGLSWNGEKIGSTLLLTEFIGIHQSQCNRTVLRI